MKGLLDISELLAPSLHELSIDELRLHAPSIHEPHEAFYESCACGDLDEAQKIFSAEDVDFHDLANGLIGASEHGKIKVVKWIFSIKGVDVEERRTEAFVLACCSGRLEVAKWIFKTLGYVDHHNAGDFAFIEACADGHLKVAKWLYSLPGGIGLDVVEEAVFRSSRADVLMWLLTRR